MVANLMVATVAMLALFFNLQQSSRICHKKATFNSTNTLPASPPTSFTRIPAVCPDFYTSQTKWPLPKQIADHCETD